MNDPFLVDYWVVFRNLDHRDSWYWSLLKNGFQHVELWRQVVPGAWLRFDTAMEFLCVEVYGDPPDALLEPGIKLLHYVSDVPRGKIRQPWRSGPVTCVELTAALLGIRLPFLVRTPYQLFKFLKRHHGSKISKDAG